MILSSLLIFALSGKIFLDPIDFTDPAESFLITLRNGWGEQITYLPVYSTPTVSDLSIPFVLDFSVFSGSFVQRNKWGYTFDVFQPDTELPMTYLFSRRGNNDYSHVGGLFSSKFGKLETNLGADFESKPDIWFGSVTKHNYLVNLKLNTFLNPSFFLLRAEKSTIEKKVLDIKKFTLTGHRISASFLYFTYKNISIPGVSVGFTPSSKSNITVSTLGNKFDNISLKYEQAFTQFTKLSLGASRYIQKIYPVFDMSVTKGILWAKAFSDARLLIDSSDFELDTFITWKRGIALGFENEGTKLNFEAGNGKNILPVNKNLLDNAWFAHLLFETNARLKNVITELGYSGYALAYKELGTVIEEYHIFSIKTLLAFSAREGKIWFFPGFRILYLNYPDHFLRADLYLKATFFGAVLLEFKLLNFTGQEPPTPIESPRRYSLLLSVVMPD